MANEPKLFSEAKKFFVEQQQQRRVRPVSGNAAAISSSASETPSPGGSVTDEEVSRKFEKRNVQVRRTNSMFSEGSAFWSAQEERKKPPLPSSSQKPSENPPLSPTKTTTSPTAASPEPSPTPAATEAKPRETVAELKARLAAKRAEKAAAASASAPQSDSSVPSGVSATSPKNPAPQPQSAAKRPPLRPIARAVTSPQTPPTSENPAPPPADPEPVSTEPTSTPTASDAPPAVPPIKPLSPVVPPSDPRSDEIRRRISERLKQAAEAKSPRGVQTPEQDSQRNATPQTAETKDPSTFSGQELLEEEKKQAEIKRRIAERKFNEEMKRQAKEAADRKAAEDAQREKEKEASKAGLEKAIAKARAQANQAAAAAARKRATEKAAEMAQKKAAEDTKKRLEEEAAAAAKKQAEEEAARKKAEEEALIQLKAPSQDDESNQEIDLDQVLDGIEANELNQVNLRMEGFEDDQTASILEALLRNTSVEFLNLDGNDLEEPSFELLDKLLALNTPIKYLSLNFVQLGDEGSKMIVSGLSKNTTVRELAISGNDLFDTGMAWIEKGLHGNSHISVLVLSENSIMDSGCRYLESLISFGSSITYLDLSNNYIEAEGAQQIASFLAKGSPLKHLNLQRNSLQNTGCIAIAQALASKDSKLQVLDIANNIIETEGILAVCASLKTNANLTQVILRHNILDINSEIALQEVLVLNDRKLDLQWRNPRTSDDTPLSALEIESIINYFGPKEIIKWYAEHVSLEPLVDIEVLLCSVVWTQADAITLFKWTFDTTMHNTALIKCFNKIMKRQINNHTTDFWLSKLVAGNEDFLKSYLAPPVKRIGLQQALVFETFAIMTSIDEDVICHVAETSDMLKYGTALFFADEHKNHSVFHNIYRSFILQLLTGERPLYYFLLSKLLSDLGFGWNLIKLFNAELSLSVAQRSSRWAHIYYIIDAFQRLDPSVASKTTEILQSVPPENDCAFIEPWQALFGLSGNFTKMKELQTVPNEDRPPHFPIAVSHSLVADELGPEDSKKKVMTVSSI